MTIGEMMKSKKDAPAARIRKFRVQRGPDVEAGESGPARTPNREGVTVDTAARAAQEAERRAACAAAAEAQRERAARASRLAAGSRAQLVEARAAAMMAPDKTPACVHKKHIADRKADHKAKRRLMKAGFEFGIFGEARKKRP